MKPYEVVWTGWRRPTDADGSKPAVVYFTTDVRRRFARKAPAVLYATYKNLTAAGYCRYAVRRADELGRR